MILNFWAISLSSSAFKVASNSFVIETSKEPTTMAPITYFALPFVKGISERSVQDIIWMFLKLEVTALSLDRLIFPETTFATSISKALLNFAVSFWAIELKPSETKIAFVPEPLKNPLSNCLPTMSLSLSGFLTVL